MHLMVSRPSTHAGKVKPRPYKPHAKEQKFQFQTLRLPSPAGCAPGLEEGLLGNLLLCNEDKGVI